ncbi:MAG: sulfurtransferase-like selenium metabolism protein YedF [Desulfobacterales bacterium]|nr:sulfurtransferase-like selenium metabolism protein YedF [Desulfobacterales bacterium]
MKEIDARGLSCPAPVLHTKATLEQEHPDTIKVLVDNAASQQNVERFLRSQGFEVRLEKEGHDFAVIGKCGSPGAAVEPKAAPVATGANQKIMVMCATDRIGFGDETLGQKLMVNFIRTLKEMGPELWRLVLVNNGVKLAVAGSPVLAELKAYEATGTSVLVCGTCLEHFNLLAQKQVGQTTNMLDIVTAMQLADKVVNL